MIHTTEKSLKELGDKASDSERKEVESAISALREVLKGDDKDAIERKTQALAEVSGKLATRVYEQQSGSQGGPGPGGGPGAGGGEGKARGAGKEGDEVVDAEFEEVKDSNNR
jgi:molecular chaperone DnaK